MAKRGGYRHKVKKGSMILNADILEQAERMAALNLPRTTIGFVLGMKPKEIEKLWNSSGDFRNAIKAGKDLAEAEFIANMVKAAGGYNYRTKRTSYRWLSPESDHPTKVKTHETIEEKHQPANSALAMFLACNMMPEDFRKESSIKIDKRTQQLLVTGDLEVESLKKLAGKWNELAEKVKEDDSETIEVESKEVESEPVGSNKS